MEVLFLQSPILMMEFHYVLCTGGDSPIIDLCTQPEDELPGALGSASSHDPGDVGSGESAIPRLVIVFIVAVFSKRSSLKFP